MIYSDKFIVNKDDDGMRLDRFVRKLTSMPQSYVERSLRQKKILLNGEPTKARVTISTNQIVTLNKINYDTKSRNHTKKIIDFALHLDLIKQLRSSIIYEDKQIIALNKPNGIAVQGGSNVSISIDNLLPKLNCSDDVKLKIVHRLDRDTSGVLLLACSDYIARYIHAAFRSRAVKKTYYAIVLGAPKLRIIDLPLAYIKISGEYKVVVDQENGKKATTKINRVTKLNSSLSLIELEAITGRKHQLRAHMAHLGHPIIGDKKYNSKHANFMGYSDNLCLHAYSVEIDKLPKIEAELPKHIRTIMLSHL